MSHVALGDIVLYNDPSGSQFPAIVTSVIDSDHVTLGVFSLGGFGGSSVPVERGTGTNQWQPKPHSNQDD